jgi:gamma-glutamyltranspeptidase/glutathione hydrolase
MMANTNTFNAHRALAVGTQGMVASAHPLASLAGVRMLLAGGNAVDAAVATAAVLNVAEPYMSGAAGVGFMLLHLANSGETKTLNFSGCAPMAANPEVFKQRSKTDGICAPLVPGNLAGWLTALETHGTMSRDQVFGPAIEHAERGVPLTAFNGSVFRSSRARLGPEAAAVFLPEGEPYVGQVIRQPDLAATFGQIITDGAEAFYRGQIARAITEFCAREGGLIKAQDLEGYRPTWQDVIRTDYRGYEVVTTAPNSEGFQILETLNLLEAYDLAGMRHNSAEYIHLLAECVKVAVADRIRFGCDPDVDEIPLAALMSKAYARERRREVSLARARPSEGERWSAAIPAGAITAGSPREYLPGLTTHFVAVDSRGNAASVTQTLGSTFGCGRLVPGTGLMLNNGINWMETDPACDTPNRVAGGKRWSVPVAPVQVFRNGRLLLAIGTPGSYGILHTTVQMLLNVLDFGATIQEAIEAPRFRLYGGTTMEIEERVPADTRASLTALGHEIRHLPPWSVAVGGGHGILIDPRSGARLGGADPRRDGYAIGY